MLFFLHRLQLKHNRGILCPGMFGPVCDSLATLIASRASKRYATQGRIRTGLETLVSSHSGGEGKPANLHPGLPSIEAMCSIAL